MFSGIFNDRADAARALAERLHEYRGRDPLILAIPRGAAPMGQILAQQLGGELDVVLVHKLGAFYNPELAIGAIDESGWTYLSPLIGELGESHEMIEQTKAGQLDALKARRARYTPFAPPLDPQGRIAIVVDDGLATGATMIAALHAVRARKPAELVCAVPVAAADSLALVSPLADKVVVLQVPPYFGAVSQFYRHFPAVTDEEVTKILSAARASGEHPGKPE